MLSHFVIESARDLIAGRVPVAVRPRAPHSDDVHLAAAVDWLMKSIEACGGNASSKGYRVLKGWMPPYPETSGYIIPTLLALSREHGDDTNASHARAIGRWLAGIQLEGGGFVGRELGRLESPIVFNTGMILLGLNALIRAGDDEEFAEPARRAGDFLISCMDEEGCFVRNLSNGILHTYNVRTAWGMLALARTTGDDKYETAAMANAEWTLRQQRDNGFFLNNTFKPGGHANTHGLAYVLRGLLEIYFLTGEAHLLDAVRLTANRVVSLYGVRRRISADLGEDWDYLSNHICLTGYAQLAIILFRLFEETGEENYLNTALSLVDDVARTQNISDAGAPHFGAIKGSLPIYGRYATLQYPNWATKFFIDALLTKKAVWGAYAHRLSV